jgi:hypothetical protein
MSSVGEFRSGVSELILRLLGRDKELIKLSNLAVGPFSEPRSLWGLPRLLFGGGGFAPLDVIVPSPERKVFASPGSMSSEVRGLSSWVGWTFSKIECCEMDAVSALEPLSLTGNGPGAAVCARVSRGGGPRSPVSNILLNASTSRTDLEAPMGSLTPLASWLFRLGALAKRPRVSLTAFSCKAFDASEPDVVRWWLALAFSNAFSMAPSSSSEASAANGSLARA